VRDDGSRDGASNGAETPPQPDVARMIADLRRRVRDCAGWERASLARRLGGVEKAFRAGTLTEHAYRVVESAIERSSAARARRAAARPERIMYPAELPVVERRAEILDAVRANQVVVICGETGSGKTTQLPKLCIDAGLGVDRMIGHTQPRRIAARTVAQRIADELGVALGTTVGYKVRFTDESRDDTLIKLMTDGVLLAETQHDPLLERYDCIIIDEAHERSLNIDFLLGYLHQLLARRPDLKLIITSATIDTERFAAHFADARGDPAPIVNVSGRTYPVEMRYRAPSDGDVGDADAQGFSELDMQDEILRAVEELAHEGPGDILVFLSGEREIRETADTLRDRYVNRHPQTEVLPLYARLSVQEQQRVFEPHAHRRIVLATNVAETSLTVPGIRYVVDPGFARVSRYSPRTRVQRLPVEKVSQASANQRAGRCGRVAPGVCIRLYSEEDFLARPAFTDPEIRRTDLASVILTMKALRLGDASTFPFVDPPEGRFVREGEETLRELHALDEKNALTPIGSTLARLPVHPRVGRMLVAGDAMGCLDETLVIASFLSAQDPRERPRERQADADAAHARFADADSDFNAILNLWKFWRHLSETLSSGRLRRACRESMLSFVRMREWQDVHRQLKDLAHELGLRINEKGADSPSVHTALLTGLLTSVGRKSEDGFEYIGAGGNRFAIHPGSNLYQNRPKWVVAGELVRTTRLYARTAARVQPEWIERAGEHLLTRQHSDPYWDADRAKVFAFEKVSLFGLVLVERRRVDYGAVDPRNAREIFIHHALVEGEMETDARYAKQNARLIADIRESEARLRRRDLLADTSARFAFFDQRVPAHVCSGEKFESWRRQAERENPRLLFMTRADLLSRVGAEALGALYPDHLTVDGIDMALEYMFEPGHDADGVTAVVPIDALHRLSPAPFEWLVPGMIEELIGELIRSLPKGVRKSIGPAPDAASACIGLLRYREGSLVEQLSGALREVRGAPVEPGQFDAASIPAHLRMRYRVIDGEGRPLGADRDLHALQRRLRAQARERLDAIADAAWSRDGITKWDFDALPESVVVRRAGSEVIGHPSLVERDKTVSLRLLESPEASREASRLGLRRLFALAIRREFKIRPRDIPQFTRLATLFAPLGSAEDLFDHLMLLIAEALCLRGVDPASIRDPRAFEKRLDFAWEAFGKVRDDVCTLAAEVLAARQVAAIAIDSTKKLIPVYAKADVEEQLGRLAPRDVLASVPLERLPHLPRYLRAIDVRLAKLVRKGEQQDRERFAQIDVFQRAYLLRKSQHEERGLVDPNLDEFRWMIEDFRVQLFAQELGVRSGVSIKKIDEQFRRVHA
jgi:ATP-dependent helicase HrpA